MCQSILHIQAEGYHLIWSLHLTPINFQQQLMCVGIQGPSKQRATCSCPGSHAHHCFSWLLSFPDSIHGSLAYFHGKMNWQTQFSKTLQITAPTSALFTSHAAGILTFQSLVITILISICCWDVTPSKNRPPHHNHPPHQTLLPSQQLTNICPGLFSAHGHPKSFLQGKLKYKFAKHHLSISISLNLWLMHCVLYFLFFHRGMKYFRLQLPCGKSTHAKMLPWSYWNIVNSQLHFLYELTCVSVPTAYLQEFLERPEAGTMRIKPPSLSRWIKIAYVWLSGPLLVCEGLPLTFMGGMHIEGEKRIGSSWEESRLQQF